MPDGGRAGFYSDWRDGPAWERFHLGELRRLLERRYRASDRRAVAGLSMGGFGAMSYAARHPGFFRAAASYSGLLDLRRSADDEGVVAGVTQSEGEDPGALWGDPDRDAARWKAHNPRDLAARLRGTRLFVSSGTGRPGPLDPRGASIDQIEPIVLRETGAFVVRLRALGIPARVDLYGPRHAFLAVLAARAAPQLAAADARPRELDRRRRVAVVQDQHVAVGIVEDRLVADAAVDDVAAELDALRLQPGARRRHVVDAEGERDAAGAELLPERRGIHDHDREVAGLELHRGHLAPLHALLQAEHGAVELARRVEVARGEAGEVDARDDVSMSPRSHAAPSTRCSSQSLRNAPRGSSRSASR